LLILNELIRNYRIPRFSLRYDQALGAEIYALRVAQMPQEFRDRRASFCAAQINLIRP
jgi:hypothetical protein